jgi:Ca2+-binding RTX toxin-like protein
MIRPFLLAIAALAIAAPAASARDAEIFATNNTATITDPADPRLDKHLDGFARRVEDIVRDGGGRPRGSDLLDGVFFDSDLGTTTFERSRVFDVDRVDGGELHDIADTVRRRFLQGSVLTFAPRAGGDAVELDVPHVTADALRAGLLADAEARERLFGGSVTLDEHLLLVADRGDAGFARTFAKSLGGDVKHAGTTYGDREFVSAATDGRARLEGRTLVLTATGDDDVVRLSGGRRVQIDFGDDGVVDFEGARRRFDRIDVLAGDGDDTVIVDDLTFEELAPEVHVTLGTGRDRLTVNGNDDDFEQSLILGGGGKVFVIGPTFVQVEDPETTDRLRFNGRGGEDLIGASTDLMRMTLDGGPGGGTILGGPGDDVLIGGNGFDDVSGGKGDDVARMGANFDRFTWVPGDGDDEVDGGARADSIFVTGSDAAERFSVVRHLHDVRFKRDDATLDLASVEEIDAIALGGADVFHVGDLRGTAVTQVNPSLAPGFGAAGGDGAADRVELEGGDVVVTGAHGAVTVTGLAAKIGISHSDGLLDTLGVDGNADVSGMEPGTIGID